MNFGKTLVSRPYIAIIDALGNLHYKDSTYLDPHLNFVQNFIKDNFKLLAPGDHSIPLGGVNLAIFKISPKASIVIFTPKGFSGQLLSFKAMMFDWSTKIDDLVGDVVIPSDVGKSTPIKEPDLQPSSDTAEKEVDKGFKKIPFLLKKVDEKAKFPIEVAKVLQFCDGTHSIDEICAETGFPKVKINHILKEYQMKKWIEFKKILT